METTQKPQEETFRIHDPAEKRQHIRQEDSSGQQRKAESVKTERPQRSTSAAKKRSPVKPAGKKPTAAKPAASKTAAPKTTKKKAAPKGKTAAKPDPDDISAKKRSYGKSKPQRYTSEKIASS